MSKINDSITDSMSIEPDDYTNESICACGHPKSAHNLYGCACGCNISSEILDDMDLADEEINALRSELSKTKAALIKAQEVSRYARCSRNCDSFAGFDCVCGYEKAKVEMYEALQKLKEKE